MSSRKYWLGLGPITSREIERGRAYFKKQGRPFDRNSDAFKNFVARLRKRGERNRFLRGRERTKTDPSAPWQIVYGVCRTGGVTTCVHTSGPSASDPHKFLHVIITVACHEIFKILAVYLDDYQVTWDTDLSTRPTGLVNATGIFENRLAMRINYGTDGQSALPVPGGDAHNPFSAVWTSNHRQRGHAHVYLRFTYDKDLFTGGIPEVDFLVQGVYNLIDPRTGSPAPGGANAAMVLYDYLTNARYGVGLSTARLDTARWQQACADCEDAIPLAGGGTQLRYLIDAVLTADESPGAVVEEMLASMAGRLVYSAGKYSLYVGKARAGAVMTLTEDMILSEVKLLTKTPRTDSFNTVKGTFLSADNRREETDFPLVTNSSYVTADSGRRVTEDLTLGMVNNAARCQRLAKIELEQNRQGIFVELTASLAAYQAEPGEWIAVTFSRYGWSSKLFEVVRMALQVDESGSGPLGLTVRLTLKETAAGIFDWNTGNETAYDLAPNTTLPDPFAVAAPSGVTLASGTEHLYVRADGTVFSRLYVTWTAAADTFVINGGQYEIQFFAGETMLAWQDASPVPGTTTATYILDVEDQVGYQVRVRSVNSLGARSAWATSGVHVVQGKSAPPSAVSAFTAVADGFGLQFSWSKVPDRDVREYELRYGTTAQAWEACAVLARVAADRFFADQLPAGAYRFRVRAVDTSGNYSATDATADLTVTAPTAPRNVFATQIDNNVLVRWEPPAASTFPVAHYRVVRQSSAAATLLDLGRVAGTFLTYVELVPGEYTYRVTAVDAAGNEGAAEGVTVAVYDPPDFVLRANTAADLSSATLANAAYTADLFSVEAAANTEETWDDHFENNGFDTVQDFIDFPYSYWLEPLTGSTGTATFTTTEGSVWAPLDATQTWEEHFTDNGVTTVQGLIDKGFANWLLPNGGLTATVEVVVDLGEVLPQTVVAFDYVSFGSGVQPNPQVSWRQTLISPWAFGEQGDRKASPSDFRYVRLVLTVAPTTPLDWCVVTDVNLTVRVKEVTDSGTTAVNSGDSGGTTITFGKSFLDVTAIVVTPQGTTELKPVVDFTDVPNPTTFKVLLFNAAGSRASGTVRWAARGVQAVL